MKRLIKSNAVYEKRSTFRRCCWYVHTEVLSRFGQEALPVPCQWTYLTTGAREESREEPQPATGSQGNSPTIPQTSSTTSSSSSSNKRKSTGSMSITKFMKRCTDPEQVENRFQFFDNLGQWAFLHHEKLNVICYCLIVLTCVFARRKQWRQTVSKLTLRRMKRKIVLSSPHRMVSYVE